VEILNSRKIEKNSAGDAPVDEYRKSEEILGRGGKTEMPSTVMNDWVKDTKGEGTRNRPTVTLS